MRKEIWFGLSIMAIILIAIVILLPAPAQMTSGHLGLLMLALVVVTIMLGFPTAFTLMGMGVFFAWLAYRSQNPELAVHQVLDLMVQRAYGVMANDVLIAIPLFVFMGYLVERANLIERLFKSLELSMARVPGSLAVATLFTCAIFATATGIVGAVVTLMGLLAFPAMLRAGYNVKLGAGAITAGGCLGILIPPSVLLIVYGATAGVSVVKLYAGAFFPGIMLTLLYAAYIIIVAKLKPEYAPPMPEAERRVELPRFAAVLSQRTKNALTGLFGALKGGTQVPTSTVLGQLVVTLLPAIAIAFLIGVTYNAATAPTEVATTEGLVEMGGGLLGEPEAVGLEEPPAEGVQEPPMEALGVQEPPSEEAVGAKEPPAAQKATPAQESIAKEQAQAERLPAPTWFWITLGICVAVLALIYGMLTWQRLEIFKMLLASFFPLAILIMAVLGTIVFGLATPTEAAAVGALGGFILAVIYRFVDNWRRRKNPGGGRSAFGATAKDLGGIVAESAFLTAKTSAMVCWLFVGSAIFSAAFALLGGQALVEKWVLSLDMSPVQFMILSQIIIFFLGWPLEWTEIIVIFMPIFIPLLAHFNVDPLFFGLLVALNLQTAFLSPPVAMAAFYLKGVSPPHVTLNQIFAGMLPFMGIQVVALVLLYVFPEIGMWLPNYLYK
jgi:TRAP-type mannitol/chloroaromatic compound transport system permease large subunit